MSISKFKQFRVEAEVCGQVRQVEWEDVEGVLAISGIHSFGEAAELLAKLSSGKLETFTLREDPPPVAHTGTVEAAKVAGENAEIKHAMTEPVQVASVRSGEVIALADQPGSQAGAAPKPSSDLGDVAALGRMTRLGEVVEELRKRGHVTYSAILAECRRLAGIGDVCPPLDVLAASNQLEDRLKTHLAGKGIAVPA